VGCHEHFRNGCGVAQLDPGGDALQHALMGHDLLGFRPARHDAHDFVTHRPAHDALAERGDDAGELQAGNLELRLGAGCWVQAHPLEQVGAIHRRTGHVDEHFIGSWHRVWHVLHPQDLDAAVFGYHHCTHGRRRYLGSRYPASPCVEMP